jgi:hypothetical protein
MLRRTFALFLALPLLLALAACGGDDDDDAAAFPTSSDPARNIPQEDRKPVNLVIASSDLFIGVNNFVIGITDKNDEPIGGAKATATFYDLRESGKPKPVFTAEAVQSAPGVGEKVTHVHGDGQKHEHGGEDEDRVGYFSRVTFNYAGFWGVVVDATLADGTKVTGNVGFNVNEKPAILAPGDKAIPSDNLTRFDVKEIREIDSGNPPNDMHDVKIKDALAAGRPLVIVFSTPVFCPSRFCGPVNEEVEALHDIYKEKVDFVHIEIWRDFDKKLLNATAREWLLWPNGRLVEPFVYAIDRNGIIYDRWEGPVARNIMEQSVREIAEGKTHK